MNESYDLSIDQIKEILDEEYNVLNAHGHDAWQLYANIIDIKLEYNLLQYNNPVYLDAKRWIRDFFNENQQKDYGYDSFSIDIFSNQLDRFPTPQALRLYLLILSYCNKEGYDCDKVEDKVIELRHKLWVEKGEGWKNILSRIANNYIWLTIVSLVFITIVAVCFLPAPTEWMHTIDVNLLPWNGEGKWHDFIVVPATAIYYIIHGETNEPIVTPVNIIGIIFIALVEFTFWGLIINFVYQKIVKSFSNAGLELL